MVSIKRFLQDTTTERQTLQAQSFQFNIHSILALFIQLIVHCKYNSDSEQNRIIIFSFLFFGFLKELPKMADIRT